MTGISPHILYDCEGGEVQAIRQGYRDKMDEVWRMAYMISAFTVIGPHLQQRSVQDMYRNLIALAFPGTEEKKRSPSDMMRELEEQSKIIDKQHGTNPKRDISQIQKTDQ